MSKKRSEATRNDFSIRFMRLNTLDPVKAYEAACENTLTINQVIGILLGIKEYYSGHTPVLFCLADDFFPIKKICIGCNEIENRKTGQIRQIYAVSLSCDDPPGEVEMAPDLHSKEEWGDIGGRTVLGEEDR